MKNLIIFLTLCYSTICYSNWDLEFDSENATIHVTMQIASIPCEGTYVMGLHNSPRFGQIFEGSNHRRFYNYNNQEITTDYQIAYHDFTISAGNYQRFFSCFAEDLIYHGSAGVMENT